MFIKFSEESQKIIKNAKKEKEFLKHAYIGSEHLVLSILNSKTLLQKILFKYGITYNLFKDELINLIGYGKNEDNYILFTPLLKRIMVNAMVLSRDNNIHEIKPEYLFLSLLMEGEGIAIRIFNKLNIDIDKLYAEIEGYSLNKVKNKKKSQIYDIGINLNKLAKEKKLDPVIGRDREVNQLIEILLRRTKNNPLLIGEAGVGKTAIVEELARRIEIGMVPDSLLNKKIISLSMASLVAGTKYRGEFEERVSKLLSEIEDSDIILFIDEIHTVIGAGGAEGAIDASNIIKPAMARGKIKLIGATTISEYKETILKDKALNRRFQNILVKEPTEKETIDILLKVKNIYEEYHHVKIDDSVIEKLVILANKYIYNLKNPDKSLDILDEVSAKCSLIKNKDKIKIDNIKKELDNISKLKKQLIINHSFNKAYELKNTELELENKLNNIVYKMNNNNKYKITITDVANVIKEKSKIPIYDVLKDDIKNFQKMDKVLKEKIKGQDEVIDELIKITKRIKLGFKNNELPTTILFKGSTGVGKTLLVKEYSKLLNMPLIRLDMSEYRESHAVSKIIGSPPGYVGYSDNNSILEKVNDNPYSIILLDEIEKSCSEVLNLFLQIFDEGVITDAKGNKINFKNTIIIMTSNIGFSKQQIGFNCQSSNNQELINILSIELINRIDKIINFNCLTYDDILLIVQNKIKDIKTKYKDNGIFIKVKKEVINDIISKIDYQVNGARKINKIIEDVIDDLVIDGVLKGNKNILIDKLEIKV